MLHNFAQFIFTTSKLMKCLSGRSMMTSSNGNMFRVTGHFVRRIHRSTVNSPHKGHWRGALMFSLICAWINGWVKQSWGWWFRGHYDVTSVLLHGLVMTQTPDIFSLADAAWKHPKYPCFWILPLEFGVDINIHKHENSEVLCSNRNKSSKEMSGNSR